VELKLWEASSLSSILEDLDSTTSKAGAWKDINKMTLQKWWDALLGLSRRKP